MTHPPYPPGAPGGDDSDAQQPGYWEQQSQPQPGQAPSGYGQAGYGYAPPKHESANTAMVLGIVALAGGVVCGLPILASPFAWAIGARAVREIDASGGRLGGRSEANAGKILGIVGTALLGLAVLLLILLIALVAVGA